MRIVLPILLLMVYASITIGSESEDLRSGRSIRDTSQILPSGLPGEYDYPEGFMWTPGSGDYYDYGLDTLLSDVLVVKKKVTM
ncbi:hypothetical protein ANCCAN_11187 [Ancylostoma caninum]|uniref:Uncharacterized protein n=1 Tax=Ancylostoma caninum TaxID=29170 RepID=A0A368GEQ6_ANCCA|nr:hypothetical protein ANCCAN_11187 [Ancylostoma caninum]